MENTISGTGLFIPVAYKKDGEIDSRSAVATLAQFGKIKMHIDSLIRGMTRELYNGKTEAEPLCDGTKAPCDYCDYKMACAFDHAPGGDTFKVMQSLKPDEFYETVRDD